MSNFANPSGQWPTQQARASLAVSSADSTKRSTKPCYVGTHPERAKDSKLVKALEAKGTVACEQPPRSAPNIDTSKYLGALANLG